MRRPGRRSRAAGPLPARAVEPTGFAPVVELARALADAPLRWAFAGGWALDLVAGAPSRPHGDVDVTVAADDGPALLDELAGRGAHVAWVGAGTPARSAPRRPGASDPAGVHQAHARWGELSIDVVLEPWTDAAWRFRRDPRIERSLDRALRRVAVGGDDVAVLAPEVVLLLKARRSDAPPLPKDEEDLARALPALDAEARAWLDAALPADHPWRGRLGRRRSGP